ncbi:MAG: hypothetical protein MRY64_14530 [Hyphomonadaceae bacterium]|nr:hypothetical protein [Hyphomonadaceae bacterium]
MAITLKAETEDLILRGAAKAGQDPADYLDALVRDRLRRDFMEHEIRPAYDAAGQGEASPFDAEAFREHLRDKFAADIIRAKP